MDEDERFFRDAMDSKDIQFQDYLQMSLEMDPIVQVNMLEGPPPSTEIYKIFLKWTISSSTVKYSFHQFANVRSPVFNLGHHEAQLVLFPYGQSASQSKYMSLYLMLLDRVIAPIKGEVKFCVDQQPPKEIQFEEVIIGGYTLWGFKQMGCKKLFLEHFCRGNKEFVVRCAIHIEHPNLNTVARHSGQGISNQVMEDFSSLLETGHFSDVTIRVGEEDILVHKNILSLRSSVFAAMFEADMVERASNVVTIADMDVGLVRDLLNFMYTGKFNGERSIATLLLQAADRYDIDDLKARCAAVLCHQVDKHNVIETIVVAERYKLRRLLKIGFSYIVSHWSDVCDSAEWTEFEETNRVLAFFIESMASSR